MTDQIQMNFNLISIHIYNIYIYIHKYIIIMLENRMTWIFRSFAFFFLLNAKIIIFHSFFQIIFLNYKLISRVKKML